MNTMGNSRQLSLKYFQKCPAWVPTRVESLWLHSVAKAQRRAAKAEKVILQARQYQNLELNSFQHQQELINYVAPLQAHRILEEPNMDSEVRLLQLAAHVTAGVADLFAIQWSDAEMGEKPSRVSNRWQMHATSFMISLVTSDPKNILCSMLFGRFLFVGSVRFTNGSFDLLLSLECIQYQTDSELLTMTGFSTNLWSLPQTYTCLTIPLG